MTIDTNTKLHSLITGAQSLAAGRYGTPLGIPMPVIVEAVSDYARLLGGVAEEEFADASFEIWFRVGLDPSLTSAWSVGICRDARHHDRNHIRACILEAMRQMAIIEHDENDKWMLLWANQIEKLATRLHEHASEHGL